VAITEDHDSTKLTDALREWREAERTTEKAQTALEATKRAAAAAKVALDAIADMAHEAELTLQAAERARDVSLRAAVEAGAALDLANGELVGGETAATDAQAAFEAARDTYKAAQERAYAKDRSPTDR
jgi:hypothetical protein